VRMRIVNFAAQTQVSHFLTDKTIESASRSDALYPQA
jgi:hypothetical protein